MGRLPAAMAPIAVFLAARADHASTALGAVLAALYALAGAIGQPLLGRVVDRSTLAAVAVPAAAVSGAAFIALAFVDCAAQPLAAAVLSVVAGAATPPLEAGLRAMWTRLVEPRHHHKVFALDSASQEVVFVAGPLLATAVCLLASPDLALVACAVAGSAGTLAVAARPPASVRSPARAVHWLGPLRSPGLLVLLTASVFFGVTLGSFTVLALSYADRHHEGWLAGVLPAALSFGSLVGGAAWAKLKRPWSPSRALPAVGTVYASAFAILLLPAPSWLMITASVLPGLFLAPWLASAFVACDALAPSGTATEAAAWLIAVIGLGQATGTATAGQFSAYGHTATAAVPLLGAALAATALVAGRRRLSLP
ncbi:MFS transporter [Kitasatospora griseola]|uniref:MFS transporter n=1 Tax=Kitasatospora griseola TaxID=2064 RepID=UPI0016716260|nr:MFS transporter [Kitasatospora griseola]GGR03503.1 MFS transporter [Kitasatospora griseola]